MLPLLVLRRLDAVLEPTKPQVLAKGDPAGIGRHGTCRGGSGVAVGVRLSVLQRLAAVLRRPARRRQNVLDATLAYIAGFSPGATEVMEAYDLYPRLKRMDKAPDSVPVLADFADLDVRPQTVSNEAMGYVFEELLRSSRRCPTRPLVSITRRGRSSG